MLKAIRAIVLLAYMGSTTPPIFASEVKEPEQVREQISDFDEDSNYVKLASLIGQITLLVPSPSGLQSSPVCTGIFLAPRIVLTAKHCIYDPAGGELSYTEIIITLPSSSGGVGTSIYLNHDPLLPSKDYDYALFRIKDGESVILPELARLKLGVSPVAKSELFLLHYPGTQTIVLTRKDCHATQPPVEGAVLHHNCETENGSSGAPLFNSKAELVGLHFRGGKAKNNPASFNQGTLIGVIFDELNKEPSFQAEMKLNAALIGANPPPEKIEAIFNLSTGATIVKRGTRWLYRIKKGSDVITAKLEPQTGIGEQLVFWNRNSDEILRFPENGGDVQTRSPDSVAWTTVGSAERVN